MDARITQLRVVASTPGGQKALVLLVSIAFALISVLHLVSTTVSGGLHFLGRSSRQNVYESTPFCNKRGQCGETSYDFSPRTVYSAKTKEQFDTWWNYYAELNQTALDYAQRMYGKEASPKGQIESTINTGKKPLVLLGDSITESLMGTELGQPSERWEEISRVYKEIYESSDYDPLILAVAGDQTQHLLWRLDNGGLRLFNGEVLPYANDKNAIFSVLIGTNNLGAGHLPDEASRGVLAVAEYLLDYTKGRVIMLQILPRGDTFRVQRLCPPRCGKDGSPFESFMPAVDKVNEKLKEEVPKLSKKYENRLTLLDCGGLLNPNDDRKGSGEEVNVDLMPDRLHPNGMGHEALQRCVLNCVERNDC